MGWFHSKYAAMLEERGQLTTLKLNGKGLAETFRAISDSVVITTEQLLVLMDLVEGKWNLF